MRFFTSSLVASVAGAASLVIACSSGDTQPEDSDSTNSALSGATPVVSGLGNLCLDDYKAGTANGNKIQIWACGGDAAQQWTFSGGNFIGPGGKCLGIHGGAQSSGNVVDLYQCNGSTGQKWALSGSAITSTEGLCLDVKGGSVASGTQVDIATCNGSAGQKWKVAGTSGGSDGGGGGGGGDSGGGGSKTLAVRVMGSHFVDANDNIVQLRGVNASSLELTAVQGWSPADPWGGQAPSFSAIKTWDSNVVRLPLNEASWLGYSCVDGTGATRNPDPGHNYQATVKKAVSDATAAGLYVILDLHWTAPKNFCPMAQNPMADADNSISFWTSIASTFKGDANVMFELFNEPYLYWLANGVTDWQALMQGGTETEYVTGDGSNYSPSYTWKTAGMQQMLDAVRATGATNVVLISGVSWAQDLSQWVANKPKDSLDQIAAVWHAYPNSGTVGDPQAALPKYGSIAYTWTESVLSAGYPVFITEFGDHDAPGTKGSPFVSNLLPWADAHGASYTGWTWDVWGDSDNVLIKDATGTPTDGYGVYTKQHYLCRGAGGTSCQ